MKIAEYLCRTFLTFLQNDRFFIFLHFTDCSEFLSALLGLSMKIFVSVVILYLCFSHLSFGAVPCLHYAGEPVTLSGQVTLKTFYGPPNYGENPGSDSRETQAILVLSKPICVGANPITYEEEEKNQREITLVPSKAIELSMYAGKKATLQGTLFHAHTAHHHTAVLMQITNIMAYSKK